MQQRKYEKDRFFITKKRHKKEKYLAAKPLFYSGTLFIQI